MKLVLFEAAGHAEPSAGPADRARRRRHLQRGAEAATRRN